MLPDDTFISLSRSCGSEAGLQKSLQHSVHMDKMSDSDLAQVPGLLMMTGWSRGGGWIMVLGPVSFSFHQKGRQETGREDLINKDRGHSMVSQKRWKIAEL